MGWVFNAGAFALALGFSALGYSLECSSALLLGSHIDAASQTITFRIYSKNATRLQVELFAKPQGRSVLQRTATRTASDIWEVKVPFTELPTTEPLYYGYRAWGPNWPYAAGWTPGSVKGFVEDVDARGNRFNPNKLLLDPYAREVVQPQNTDFVDEKVFYSGHQRRQLDSAQAAPKGIVLPPVKWEPASYLRRPLKDEVIYEVHVRGFTMNDPLVPTAWRGTYRGAAAKAQYLRTLGITAVEFLPIHEYVKGPHNNYWGYMTLNYFSPNRDYATELSRKTPGGVTQEFKEMVAAFHAVGIKVYLDVVHNHTAEGSTDDTGDVAQLLSFRGLDNQTYYQASGRRYKDNNGCGPNFNCTNETATQLILDSKAYFHSLGVDGFRDDLASVEGEENDADKPFRFNKMRASSALNRALKELPARPVTGGLGVDLIAEPWGWGEGTYQLGGFPSHPESGRGWAEWNGRFRNTIRASINKVGIETIRPGEIAMRVAGSSDLFGSNGRKPSHSINFVTSHDGFTLRDLFSYNDKVNNDGDSHNLSWDQGMRGENDATKQARQRQAARTAMALNLFSLGVPMILGGDEFLRTQKGHNNTWNMDTAQNWLDWNIGAEGNAFRQFTQRAIAFRRQNGCFTPLDYPTDIEWLQADGRKADSGYMDNTSANYLGWRMQNVFLSYNWGFDSKAVLLPYPRPGMTWGLAADTGSQKESTGNFSEPGHEVLQTQEYYQQQGRSLAVFIEKPIR